MTPMTETAAESGAPFFIRVSSFTPISMTMASEQTAKASPSSIPESRSSFSMRLRLERLSASAFSEENHSMLIFWRETDPAARPSDRATNDEIGELLRARR